jgi:hypothetical protein
MTAKAALCLHLLKGEVLNIKNVFTMIGFTNCPREISRMVEKPFGVQVSRTRREGKSRYGQPVFWYDYRLNRTDYNAEGIQKMTEYVQSQISNPKTQREQQALNTIQQLQFFQ